MGCFAAWDANIQVGIPTLKDRSNLLSFRGGSPQKTVSLERSSVFARVHNGTDHSNYARTKSESQQAAARREILPRPGHLGSLQFVLKRLINTVWSHNTKNACRQIRDPFVFFALLSSLSSLSSD